MKRYFSILIVIPLILLSSCNIPISTVPVSSNNKTILTVLAGQSTSDAGIEDIIDKRVNQKFPQVELEWETMDWGEYFHSQMKARFAAGDAPDLIIGKAQDVASYYSSGVLAPFPTKLAALVKKEALSGTRFNDKVYGIPYNALYQGVIYNKNIFWRYNLKPPKDLSQMKTIVKRLNQVGMTPFATHFQENWFIANITMQFALNQVFLTSPDWGNQFRKKDMSFTKSKDMQNCLQQVKFILDNSWNDAFAISQQESDKRFIQERAAMYLTGSWSLQAIQAMKPDMQIGIFPFPNQYGTAKLIYEPNMTFMKSATTKHGRLIDSLLLSFLNDKDLAESIYGFTQTASVLQSVETQHLTLISSDINSYSNAEKIMDATVGNSQLGWEFQDQLASMTRNWLDGKTDFTSVLTYADQNRLNSGPVA